VLPPVTRPTRVAARTRLLPRPSPARAAEQTRDCIDYFEKHIRPVLADRCFPSTATNEARGRLTLDMADALRKRGDNGPVVAPGNPAESWLIQAVHDFHATILHLWGFEHERLRYRHAGHDFRLTDVSGRVVKEMIA